MSCWERRLTLLIKLFEVRRDELDDKDERFDSADWITVFTCNLNLPGTFWHLSASTGVSSFRIERTPKEKLVLYPLFFLVCYFALHKTKEVGGTYYTLEYKLSHTFLRKLVVIASRPGHQDDGGGGDWTQQRAAWMQRQRLRRWWWRGAKVGWLWRN